jgi:tight adherence protein B
MNIPALIVATGIATGCLLLITPLLWPRVNLSSTERAEQSVDSHRLVGRRATARIRVLLDESGFANVSTGALIGLSSLIAVVLAGVVFLISPLSALVVCAGFVGALAPTVYLKNRRARRASERAGQWPDVADTLISHIRAGASIVDAVSALAETIPGSIGSAAQLFNERTLVSGNVTQCLRELKLEWADPSGDRIIEALCVTRDVGGTRLTNVLRDVSRSLRHDLAVRREITARQSWIRVAAGIGAAAPWVVIVLLSMRPEAVAAYESSAGVSLILGGLTLSVLAYNVMTRIGRLPAEKRWFA